MGGNDEMGGNDGWVGGDGLARGLRMLIGSPLGVLIAGLQELTFAVVGATGEPHAVAGFPLSRE